LLVNIDLRLIAVVFCPEAQLDHTAFVQCIGEGIRGIADLRGGRGSRRVTGIGGCGSGIGRLICALCRLLDDVAMATREHG